MNKTILAALIIPAFIAGCGSSGGSSPTPIEPVIYKWQIVQLKSVPVGSLAETCVIYADSALNQGEVITAYIADRNFKIIYHNEDGTISKQFIADNTTNGQLMIDSDDVPDNGYVTLEEFTPSSNTKESYMFSVQKSLMTDLVLNVKQTQTDTCVTGNDYRETYSTEAKLNIPQISVDTEYYQSSYNVNSINGQVTSYAIPVNTPYPGARDILITAYDEYDANTEQKIALSQWGFIEPSFLYEDEDVYGAKLSELELEDIYLSNDNNSIDLDEKSGVIAVHNNNSYFWQPIYNNSDTLTVAFDSNEVSTWSGYFSGTVDTDNWSFESFIALTGETYLDFPTLPTLGSVDYVTVTSNCNIAANHCIDTDASFNSNDFNYQRTHLRLEESGTNNNYTKQTILSEVNEDPVVLQSSTFTLVDPTLIRAEFNLMATDAGSTDAVKYLMSNNIDLVTVGEYSSDPANDVAEKAFFNDINGYVVPRTTSESLYKKMLEKNTTTMMATYEQ
ncbi:hypothetical protein GCM10007916_25270 [Psychromonas marina]|uniref:SPOR domain-containing protein n=1 Tax=Psychromonas marina TaxID=88364 RepID=A0ABQ6E234_9GAMM|nr:hypothetical protein [Psychromonas marina]GLS91458.1 hypothetical protein GCM10007916_25270 [Psychromonas marina]